MDQRALITQFIQTSQNIFTFVFDLNYKIIESTLDLKGYFTDYITGDDRHKLNNKLNQNRSTEFYFLLQNTKIQVQAYKAYLWFSENKYFMIAQECTTNEYYTFNEKSDQASPIFVTVSNQGEILSCSKDKYKTGNNFFQDHSSEQVKIIKNAFFHCIEKKIVTGFEINTSTNFDQSLLYRFLPEKLNEQDVVKVVIQSYAFNGAQSTSNSYFQDIIDSSVDFIYKSDFMGNFIFINDVAKKRYGLTEKNGSKINFTQWVRKDYKDLVEKFYKNQFKSKLQTTYLEFPTVTDEGEEIWIGQNVRLILSGDWILSIQSTSRDITENKIIENELMEIQNKNQAILDAIPDSMFLVDDNMHLLDKKVEEESYFFNINVGDKITECSLSTSLLKTIEQAIMNCFSSQDIVKLEVNYHVGGKEQIFDLRVAPVNNAICLILVRNISSAIFQYRKFQKSQEKEREALDAKQRYLSFMTHEIRTPLNAIIGLTDLIFDTNPTPKQLEYLKTIKSSGSFLSKIINDVLDYNKLENNKIKLVESDFDLSTIFKEVLNTCNVYSFNKPIILKHVLDPQIPKVMKGDAFKLTQILTNLVSNAIKFTTQGSVILSAQITSINENIIIIEFGVKDTGIGIPEDKLEKVFNSYEQLDTVVSRKFGGTGLGLTISQKFVELMNGKISLESKPDVGSYFSFKIPLHISSEGLKLETQNRIVDFTPYHILLVEDNDMNQLVMSKYFNKWGLSFDIAENGKQALNMIEENEYNLILLDLEMPIMDGFETAENIRNHKNSDINKTIIVALSASVFSEVEEKTKKIGFNDFIGKPINANYVYKKLAEYLVKPTHTIENLETPISSFLNTMHSDTNNYDLSYLIESSFNDISYVRKMVDLFLRKTPEYLKELDKLYKKKDYGELKKLAHKFKASLSIMGIQKAEETIHTLEMNITNKIFLDKIESQLEIIKESCENACKELKERVESNTLF